MVSISPFVNKMFYSRLFTASLARQKARGQLSGGVSWVVGHCNTLKRLTDQTESEEGTLRANALPSKKRSLAFVLAVLKYNLSPETIDEMISNLREMQTEIQVRLKNLETSFNDVQISYDFFRQQLVRAPRPTSLLSTSTTLTARVQLASWLEIFGGRGFSERRRKGSSVVSPLNLFLGLWL